MSDAVTLDVAHEAADTLVESGVGRELLPAAKTHRRELMDAGLLRDVRRGEEVLAYIEAAVG